MRLLLIVSLLLSGCTSLLVREDDSAPVVATKVFWRTVFGISTLGLSELNLANHRDEYDVQYKLESYREHLTYHVNNGSLTQTEAEALYQQYATTLMRDAREQAQRRMGPLNALAAGFGLGLGAAVGSASYSGQYYDGRSSGYAGRDATWYSPPPPAKSDRSYRGMNSGSVYVRPYTRRDGTFVQGHMRSSPRSKGR